MRELQLLKPTKPLRYGLAAWNMPSVRPYTNCLTYSLNCAAMGTAFPGNLRNPDNPELQKNDITVAKVRALLISDGLEDLSEKEALSGERHVIAVRVRKKQDLHCYRNDEWSHKMNGWHPSRYDDKFNLIANPRLAKLDGYPEFCGYFAIPEKGILYMPRLKIAEDLKYAFT